MMKTTIWEMILRAKEPLTHAKGVVGNRSMIMSKEVQQPDGTIENIPYGTGDMMKHHMREIAAYVALASADLLDDPQLERSVLRFLFNGGTMTKKGDASVFHADRYRELVSLFPVIGLFGGVKDDRPMPGQVEVSELNLISDEMMHVAPSWVQAWCTDNLKQINPCWALIEEQTRVNMDVESRPELVRLLKDTQQTEVYDRMRQYELAREHGDQKAISKLKSKIMPRSHQRFIQGSLFWWGALARTYTELELDCFNYTMAVFCAHMKIGAAKRSGHGAMEVVTGRRIHQRPLENEFEGLETSLSKGIGELYRQHLTEHKEDLRAWLMLAINS